MIIMSKSKCDNRLGRQLKYQLCTLSISRTRRPTNQRADREDLRIQVPFRVERKHNTKQAPKELTRTMYPLSNQRRCMIRNVPTTTSRAVKRLKDLSVPKTHIAAIRPQRTGRQVPVLHRPACLTSATVPEIRPSAPEMIHDPCPRDEYGAEEPAWMG